MADYTQENARDHIAQVIANLVAGETGTTPDAGDVSLAQRIVTRLLRREQGQEEIRILGTTGSYMDLLKCMRIFNEDLTVPRARRLANHLPRDFTVPDWMTVEEAEEILNEHLVQYVVL